MRLVLVLGKLTGKIALADTPCALQQKGGNAILLFPFEKPLICLAFHENPYLAWKYG